MQKATVAIGIVGFGTMGSSLAQLFAQSGMKVVAVDANPAQLEQGMQRIQGSLDSAVKKKLLDKERATQIRQQIITSTQLDELRPCQLIIEAVFENRKLKQQLFKQLQLVANPEAILATNTSSFKVEELMPAKCAGRFVGLHFFYPPAQNRLLEMILPKQVKEASRHWLFDLASATGRAVIECEDSYGFVVNRFFVPWLNEAVQLLDAKVASLEAINSLSKTTFDSPLGAFDIMNLTGLSPIVHSMETFHAAFGKAYQVARTLKIKAKDQSRWEVGGDDVGEVDPRSAKQIFDRLQSVVYFNVERLLKEKVCGANDIAIGARLGLQWRRSPLPVTSKGKKSPKQSFTYIRTVQRGGSRLIELNRTQAMNAFNGELVDQLDKAFDAALKHRGTERIILRGWGKCFASGGDLTALVELAKRQDLEAMDSYFANLQRLFLKIDCAKKPVIAFVSGGAFGGGAQLALAADWIIATPKASFAFPETGIGLIPGLGGTQRLPLRIGRELAKALIFTGQVVDATTAQAMGLVDAICSAFDWHTEVVALIQPGKRSGGRKPNSANLTGELATLISLLNNKNCSRLIQGKSKNLPTGLEAIELQLRRKQKLSLQLANHLIDQAPADSTTSLEHGLQLELEALKQLVRQPNITELLSTALNDKG